MEFESHKLTPSGHTEPKKNSLFASVFPSPAAAQAPAGPAPAPDPVGALKQKIEAMEKNLTSLIEKKAAETGQPQPKKQAAAPSEEGLSGGTSDLLLGRMGELEKKLEEFGRSAMFSASQMKNIEESKISARREIEGLLGAVREQQKYSEMDRQMHDQLEKSWNRVGELEKKLMDFYSHLLSSEEKDKAAGKMASDSFDKFLSAISDLNGRVVSLEAKLDRVARAGETSSASGERSADLMKSAAERLAALETALGKVLRAEELSADSDQKGAAAVRDLSGRLAALDEKMDEALRVGERAGTSLSALEERLGALDENMQRSLRGGERAEASFAGLEKHLAELRSASAAGIERLQAELMPRLAAIEGLSAGTVPSVQKLLADYAVNGEARLSGLRSELTAKLSGLEQLSAGTVPALRDVLAEQARADEARLAELRSQLSADVKKFEEAVSSRLEARLDKIAEREAEMLALRKASEALYTASDTLLTGIASLENTLEASLREIDKTSLGGAIGVSGMLLRKKIEGMEYTLHIMRGESARLDALKQDLRREMNNGKE